VQRATCRRADVDQPLSLFVDIVPQLRELPGALGCEPETFSWLKRLTEFEKRSDDSRQIDSDTLFQNVRAALFDLLDSVAEERSLVILVEDVQWLDAASARILTRMMEWCATKRLFFLVNARPGGNSFLDYAEKVPLDTITLGPLKPAASTALLQSVALRPGDKPEPEFIGWCLAVAEGNPFFLQELAHQWIETGQRYEAPPSVTKVLHERLSRLGRDALQVLQTCVVLGDQATMDRVERILEYPPHQLLSAVGELSRAAMLTVSTGDVKDLVPTQLLPRHDFLASAALRLLPSPSFAFMHGRAADVLEKEIAETVMPTTLLWACANLRHSGGDKKRALALRLSCAQHLIDVGLAEDACRRYEDSLANCTSDEDRLAVLSPLSVALQLTGEWERSKEVLRTCIRLHSKDAPESHSEFEVMLFNARLRSGLDFVTLLNDILPCVRSPRASPEHRVSAGVVALKVASDVGPSMMLDAIYSEIEPFLTREEIDPVSRLEVEIIYQTMRGRNDLDLGLLERFALAARSLHGEIAYSHALVACSSSCRIGGKDEDARKFVEAALEHAFTHKLLGRIATVNLSRIRLYVAAEDWVNARAALCTQQQYPISSDDKNTAAEWNFFNGRVALEEGDMPAAEAAISKLEIVPHSYSANRNAASLALSLRVHLACGCDANIIRPLVRDLESTHTANWDIGYQDFEAHALFLGLASLGEENRALALLRDYVQEYRRSRRPLSKPIREALLPR
jgi:hypothetical protein